MAVLKFLVSAALLGTVAQCQTIYSAYSPATLAHHPQYSPSILSRGTPRLIPVKVRAAASRLIPSFYYPQIPPPMSPTYKQRFPRQIHPLAYSSTVHSPQQTQPSFQRPTYHQPYRSAMTGYYRPTRQSFFNLPFQHFRHNINHEQQHQLTYQAAATSAPATLKKGRFISAQAQSPYTLASASSAASAAAPASTGTYHQYAPHSIPAVSTYRAPPPQIQHHQLQHHQIAHAPVSHHQLRPQPQIQPQPQQLQYQPQIQPNFYIQKSPVVVGPASARPHKLLKVKKVRPVHQQHRQIAEAPEEEEEYPGDPNPQYNFSFDIKDDELTNYQNRQEERDGQTIKGSYSVVDPDGYVRTVTYTADPKNGFQAKVTREPTDVKIKFPVPTEAPAASQAVLKTASGQSARRPAYVTQQYHQPQYQSAYSSPQVYASGSAPVPAAVSSVDAGSSPVAGPTPQQYLTRTIRRFSAVQQQQQSQPQAEEQAEASESQPKVVAISRGIKRIKSQTQAVQQEESTE